MAAMQYRTKKGSISYSSTKTDRGNKVMEVKQRLIFRK